MELFSEHRAILVIARFRFQDAALTGRAWQKHCFREHRLTLHRVAESLETFRLINTQDQSFAIHVVIQPNFDLRSLQCILVEVASLSRFQILLRRVEHSAVRRHGFVRGSGCDGSCSGRGEVDFAAS